MKKYLALIIILFGFQLWGIAQKNKETFTIYLVRHAEKDFSSGSYSDPPLTECGQERAENLSYFLQDVNIDVIYSTEYNRTKGTAQPTSDEKKVKIKLYNAQELEDFSKSLIECKKDVLVVGHSYTTGVLAGLLVGEDIGAYDLGIYNRIYKVVFYNNNGRIHLLHTSFECIE